MTASPAILSSLRIGDVTLDYLPDGVHHCEGPAHYPDAPDGIWDEHPELLDSRGFLVMSLGSILIRSGGRTVLVDLGIGRMSIDISTLTGGVFRGFLDGGDLPAGFAAVGVDPAEVDTVVLTHLHIDHVGWAAGEDGGHFLPNARYVVARSEWEHFTRPEVVAVGQSASAEQLALLGERLDLIDGPTTIADGVATMPTPGHTPGHTSVVVTSGGQRAVVLGDAVHSPVEFHSPGICFVHDHDLAQAASTRKMLVSMLLEAGTWFVGGHFPDRVFGRLRATAHGGLELIDP